MRLEKKELLADDATEGVDLLIRLRLPWLVVGLLLGTITSFLVSHYEEVLAQNISLVFFMPVIVYIASAIGTQTETIYVRNLGKKELRFNLYVAKEFLIGISIGAILGFLTAIFAYFWLQDIPTALTIGLAMFVSIAVAPVVALVVAAFLHKEHSDPALGAGPFTTIIQDIISLLIYFLIASALLFK